MDLVECIEMIIFVKNHFGYNSFGLSTQNKYFSGRNRDQNFYNQNDFAYA